MLQGKHTRWQKSTTATHSFELAELFCSSSASLRSQASQRCPASKVERGMELEEPTEQRAVAVTAKPQHVDSRPVQRCNHQRLRGLTHSRHTRRGHLHGRRPTRDHIPGLVPSVPGAMLEWQRHGRVWRVKCTQSLQHGTDTRDTDLS
jgi:hypothetical protein